MKSSYLKSPKDLYVCIYDIYVYYTQFPRIQILKKRKDKKGLQQIIKKKNTKMKSFCFWFRISNTNLEYKKVRPQQLSNFFSIFFPSRFPFPFYSSYCIPITIPQLKDQIPTKEVHFYPISSKTNFFPRTINK